MLVLGRTSISLGSLFWLELLVHLFGKLIKVQPGLFLKGSLQSVETNHLIKSAVGEAYRRCVRAFYKYVENVRGF